MKKIMGLLTLILLGLLAVACGNASPPPLGEANAETFVFVYTDN